MMMVQRGQLAILTGFLLFSPSIGTRFASMSGNPCSGSSAWSTGFITHIQNVVTATDTNTVTLRTNMKLLATAADSVTLVTDSATCWRARNAYVTAITSDTTHVPSVFTFRVGSLRYLTTDFQVHGGEFTVEAVTDTSFTVLGGAAS